MAFANNNILHLPATLLTAALFSIAAGGCIRDDRSGCEPPAAGDIEEVLVVRAMDLVSGADITSSGAVTSASLFMFDGNQTFLARVDIPQEQLGREVEIPIPATTRASAGDTIYISAWGNIEDGVTVDEGICEDYNMDDTCIDLKHDDDNDGCMKCPGSIFFGLNSIVLGRSDTRTADNKIIHIVRISQKSARLHITVRGLPAEDSDDDYYFSLCRQNDGYTFGGVPVDDDARDITESGVFDDLHDFVSPQPYNLVPSIDPEGIGSHDCATIHLFRRGASRAEGDIDLSGAVSQDSDGNYIALRSGETTNVYIEFLPGGGIEVKTAVTPWDKVYQWSIW